VSTEFQELIEKEQLIQDRIKLQNYKNNSNIINTINKVRDELLNDTNKISDKIIINKFAKKLKEELR